MSEVKSTGKGKGKKSKTAKSSLSASDIAPTSSSSRLELKHVLKNMYNFLITGIEKEIVSTGIYQSILWAYLSYCSRYEFENMYELIVKPHLYEIQNCFAGVCALNQLISRSFFKASMRKQLVNQLVSGQLIIPMCCDKQSWLTMVRLFQCVDDTKLMQKRVLTVMLKEEYLNMLCFHDFGRLTLIALLYLDHSDMENEMVMHLRKQAYFDEACTMPVIDIDQFRSEIVTKFNQSIEKVCLSFFLFWFCILICYTLFSFSYL